jgi:hypothetical protein
MPTPRKKLQLLEAAVKKAENFVAAGGDVKSPAAAPVWMNLLGAFETVARQFGYEIAKPVESSGGTSTPPSKPTEKGD